MKYWFYQLFYPQKCIFCGKVLDENETDLCRNCRKTAPEFPGSKIKLSFLAQWTGLWYYKENVRQSLLRYKFRGRRNYAAAYGRMLAMKLQSTDNMDWDVLSWVPIARLRQLRRGFDQSQLIAEAVAKELDAVAVQTLRKVRNTKPQSGLGDAAHRRANILGAYEAVDPELWKDKRILLLDDVVTTGATASECAKTLLLAGAKEIKLATVAVATHDKR